MIQKLTPSDLKQSFGKTVPDIIAPNLRVLFCGINPGLYSGAVGHHFAHPGNRFWPALFEGGFTPYRFSPFEEEKLLSLNLGIINLFPKATLTANQVQTTQLKSGAQEVIKKVRQFQPKFLAVLGIQSYRIAFGKSLAKIGLQEDTIGQTKIWVLPNPSGINAHYTPKYLAKLFRELNLAAK